MSLASAALSLRRLSLRRLSPHKPALSPEPATPRREKTEATTPPPHPAPAEERQQQANEQIIYLTATTMAQEGTVPLHWTMQQLADHAERTQAPAATASAQVIADGPGGYLCH